MMDMWDAMDAAFPEKADECMVAFLRRRAKTTSYMLQPSDCKFDVPVWPGYGSDADFQAARGRLRESVTNAFEAAYVASLDMPGTRRGRFEDIRTTCPGCYARTGAPGRSTCRFSKG